MKIVLDTKVLVAGLLTPFGPCAQIVRMVSSGDLTLCLDARILSEYDEVLRRPKFGFETEKVTVLLDYIEHAGEIVASSPSPGPLPDPDDQAFLEVAMASHAQCLITGSRVHFPRRLCHGVRVLSPSEFLTFYRSQREQD